MSSTNAMTLIIGGVLDSTFLGSTGRAKMHVERLGSELARLRKQQRALTGGKLFGRGDSAIVTQEVGDIMHRIDMLEARKARLNRSFKHMDGGKEMMGNALKGVGAIFAGAQLFLQPIKAASRFEDAMLGVAKQLDGARDAQGKLTPAFHEMKEEILKLGKTIPMATNDIAEMTAAGLRMGVAKEEVIDFVKTSAMMATAFEMPAGIIAEEMGKISGVYKIDTKDIGGLADAINYLDDNAKSKGADIINVMKRIGGVATMVGMSAKDAAALGSTFLTLGASAEVAATASNAVIRELSVAASQPDKFQDALKILFPEQATGADAKQASENAAKWLQGQMAKDATGTIQMVLERLNGVDQEQRLTIATKLFGKEYGDDVAKLAGSLEEYRRQLKLANSEEAKGSMAKEAAARDGTASAQWQLVKNQAQAAMVSIGDRLLPVAMENMKQLAGVLGEVAEFAKKNGPLLEVLFAAAAKLAGAFVSVKAAMLVFGGGRYIFGSVISGAQMARENVARLADALDSGAVAGKKRPGFFRQIRSEFSGIKTDIRRIGTGFGALFSRANHAILNASIKLWGVGQRALGALSLAWTSAGKSAVKFGGMLKRGLLVGAGAVRSILAFMLTTPLGLAITLLTAAGYLIYKNWDSFKWFAGELGELWDSVMLKVGDCVDWCMDKFEAFATWLGSWVTAAVSVFGVMRDAVGSVFDWIDTKVQSIIGALQKMIDAVRSATQPVRDAYSSIVSKVSDGFEFVANLGSGERVRADAPVTPRRLPQLPAAGGRAGGTHTDNSTVTINIQQLPGESASALARQAAKEIERNRQMRQRSMMHDPVPAL